ncbi:MAG TPA: Holliday junction resolvase-like protein [Gemmatimonadaceae bacterium]|jgi:predicted Holliday junction resolvase-like endonuclease|nr:Holliday junction resolvase-like protein [Gemmatimonadaceae bacterium]
MGIAFVFVVVLASAVLLYTGYRLIEVRANLKFEQWKIAYSKQIRREAITGSQAAVAGRVFERVAPYLPGFGYNPRDVRFVGDPVDFVVFDGLSEGNVRNVVFVEVKTGLGELNGNERRVKAAITERRVEWSLFRVQDGQPDVPHGDLVAELDAVAEPPNKAAALPPSSRAALIDRGRF